MRLTRDGWRRKQKYRLTIRSKLTKALLKEERSLTSVACICEAIAADARFNAWMGVMEKKIDLDEGLGLIDEYDRLYHKCFSALEIWAGGGDAVTFQSSMIEFAQSLRDLMNAEYKLVKN